MGKIPFNVRPIKLDEAIVQPEPVSITHDLSGKMTLSSKHVAVNLYELAETLKKKDVSNILLERGGEEIIITTNTVLKLARANDATTPEDQKKYWAGPMLIGFILGIVIIIALGNNVPWLLVATVSLAAFFGGLVGFVWQKVYETRFKQFIKDWARALLEE